MQALKIRVKTKSEICNLAYESIIYGKLEEREKAEKLHNAYEAWLDSIPEKYPGESADRSLAREDGIPELDSFIRRIMSELPESVETIEASSAGRLVRKDDGQIELRYDESGILGMNCKTVLVFDSQMPGLITMYRTGTSGASLVFDSGSPRVTCSYDTEIGSIFITVLTHRVVNTAEKILDGDRSGKIILDYTLEMGGVRTEYSHLELQITACAD